jgi:PIN domain nuclease of toxin-antitoxin system
MIHLDTHVVLWLAEGRVDLLPPGLRGLLAGGRTRPLVSPMVRLELTYLYEVGRIVAPAAEILEALRVDIDLGPAESPFERVAAIACAQSWTRDPFDRLIVAHAVADDLPLYSRDAVILANAPIARWS